MNELKHYGVPGMKWGVRKTQPTADIPASRRTRRLEQKTARQRTVVESWKDSSPIKDSRGRTIYSRDDVKDIYEGAKRRLEKLEYKLAISKKRDQINAGSSAVGRLWNKITEADKLQAEIEYDIEKRARVNKAWRD